MNLINAQQEAIDALLALPEQGKRATNYRCTLLNKPPRSVRRIRRRYEAHAARMKFTVPQVAAQWQDVKDMALLEARAA